ncbi:hypothetical protein GCM10011376_23970 [Nocardioides flavus (ex Wang et al. 2016)]|uniref:DUF3048 domain-containing protein n=1 Tax=Nocardioides flavus (ex Wang et al. 2016) TaxID=2058780 RepID=A0ABQ3HJD0_9ACTN|nr:DUF3048 domain-containing protein [Nocardioides flavus (ex Wang et al. 2016)]GHE17787.1 hypothetical protein GCM10011376_23970 [Nocardioides flavus (ex Wang et al. 2016)]
MRHRPHRSPSQALAAVLVAGSLLLAGCSGGDEEPASSETAAPSEPTASETTEPPEPTYWPLTGLERTGKAPKHPVIVTKVDNTSSSAPQVGLGSADLVVEELVEGGYTRLAAFYYSKVPASIGPVRSMRASDIGIVPDGATVVTSGAAPITVKRINGAGIPWLTEGDAGVYRETSRSAPYNLFARLGDIAKRLKAEEEPPPYLPWGTPSDLPRGGKARTLTADFGAHSTSWQFQKGGYVNTDSYAAQGDQFPADSVLVLRVRVGDAGYRDPAGYPVPETKLEGKGAALLFHGGRVVRGTWSKDGLKGPIELSTKQGELTVPAGRVWVELVPAATGNVTFAK